MEPTEPKIEFFLEFIVELINIFGIRVIGGCCEVTLTPRYLFRTSGQHWTKTCFPTLPYVCVRRGDIWTLLRLCVLYCLVNRIHSCNFRHWVNLHCDLLNTLMFIKRTVFVWSCLIRFLNFDHRYWSLTFHGVIIVVWSCGIDEYSRWLIYFIIRTSNLGEVIEVIVSLCHKPHMVAELN